MSDSIFNGYDLGFNITLATKSSFLSLVHSFVVYLGHSRYWLAVVNCMSTIVLGPLFLGQN